MATHHDPRIDAALDKLSSSLKHYARTLSYTSVVIDDFRLAIPTKGVRAIQQSATAAIDRIMSK